MSRAECDVGASRSERADHDDRAELRGSTAEERCAGECACEQRPRASGCGRCLRGGDRSGTDRGNTTHAHEHGGSNAIPIHVGWVIEGVRCVEQRAGV